jgi:hypothetical protein
VCKTYLVWLFPDDFFSSDSTFPCAIYSRTF